MIGNVLRTFLRQLLKHRLFSLINIIGLSVALTACLLINSFVMHELSYDRHYANAERLYQFASRIRSADQRSESAIASALVAPMLKENVAEVDEVARLGLVPAVLAREDKVFREEKLGFADNTLFTLFDFRWIEGSPDAALAEPASIVLTQGLARKYFGDESPLGQTLLLNNSAVVSVTGLIEDLPANTHFDFSALLSLQQLETVYPVDGVLDSWNVGFVATYLLLKPGMDEAQVAAQLPVLRAQYSPTPPDLALTTEWLIKKVTSIHLQPELDDPASGSLTTVVVFGITALSILLIAVINFVNLAISRYAARSREVGVRKSAGASKAELLLQFCGEAVLLAVGAMLFAVAASELMMPLVETLTGNPIPFTYLSDPRMTLTLLALAVLLGLLAGLYPAWYFASVQAAAALRGRTSSGKAALQLRNVLVMFQFAAAIFIIVVTLVIHRQMQHIESMDMGYRPEMVVELDTPPEWDANYASFWESFKAQLLADPGISSVTHSLRDFMSIGGFISQFRTGGATEARRVPVMNVGHDFFSTYQVPFLSGRDFSPEFPTDALYPADLTNPGATLTGSFILNELAAQEFGWTPQEALGQTLYYADSTVGGTVIGVVNNTLRSSRDLLRPVVYYTSRSARYSTIGGRIALRVAPDNLERTLAHVDTTWARFFPGEPVSRFFLQDQIDAQYLTETRQASLFRYFALLSIVLSCMGLLGLAAFNAERRTREVGVRKVMGGSVWSIVLLLTNDFSRLVLLSNLIAWPLAYLAMQRWLENFAYRIDLTPLIFIGSGLIALCIAWVTVGGTAAKAATQKPVLALRYE